MAVWTYENVTPSLIPNTTMELGYSDGVAKLYRITPNEGYVLHDNTGEYEDLDGTYIYQFASYRCSCGANYDFDNTTTVLGYTAYGSREFFAIPVDEVPDRAEVYGIVNPTPKPEIM